MLTDRQIRKIVLSIREDLNDRRGLHLDSIDRDIQSDILRTWSGIIRRIANGSPPTPDAERSKEQT